MLAKAEPSVCEAVEQLGVGDLVAERGVLEDDDELAERAGSMAVSACGSWIERSVWDGREPDRQSCLGLSLGKGEDTGATSSAMTEPL